MEFLKEKELDRQDRKSHPNVEFKLVEQKLQMEKEVNEIDREVNLHMISNYTKEILLDCVHV